MMTKGSLNPVIFFCRLASSISGHNFALASFTYCVRSSVILMFFCFRTSEFLASIQMRSCVMHAKNHTMIWRGCEEAKPFFSLGPKQWATSKFCRVSTRCMIEEQLQSSWHSRRPVPEFQIFSNSSVFDRIQVHSPCFASSYSLHLSLIIFPPPYPICRLCHSLVL